MKDRKLTLYLIFAFSLAWPVQLCASNFALQGNDALFRLVMALCMFVPLAATIMAGIPLRDMGWSLRLRGKGKWILAAWFAPILLSLLGAAIYFLFFPGRLDLSGEYYLAQLRAAVGEEGLADALAQMEEKGITLPLMTLISALSAVTYAPFLNGLLALGEEAGWRGAMLPRLKARFGRRKGWLLGGLIWGVWHWPVILMAGYEYGLEYWGAPVLGPLAFCLFTVAAGLLLDLCYEKTRCLWIPALGHGAINAATGVPLYLMKPEYADQLILGPAMHGLIAGIPLFALAAWVLLRAKKPADGQEAPAA